MQTDAHTLEFMYRMNFSPTKEKISEKESIRNPLTIIVKDSLPKQKYYAQQENYKKDTLRNRKVAYICNRLVSHWNSNT